MIRTLLPFAMTLLLAGCSPDTPEAMLADYLDRVAKTLDQQEASADGPNLLLLPGRRQRRMAVTELRTGLLETLDFRDCGLLPLIAERNSSLGRVMKPSTTLRYELKFFERLLPCYRRDQVTPWRDKAFSELLAETYRIKRSNLQAVVWNGIFTSEALEHNLSLSAPPVALAGNPGYGDSLQALEALRGYRSLVSVYETRGQLRLPEGLDAIEDHYEVLTHSEYGSQLFRSLALLTQYLNRTAATLETTLAGRPVCFGKKPTPKARILKNVFIKYYAGNVQPYMAMIHRQGEPWLRSLDSLMAPQGLPVPTELESYRRRMLSIEAPDALWQQYQGAIRRHTQAWQDILGQCGLMPTGASL